MGRTLRQILGDSGERRARRFLRRRGYKLIGSNVLTPVGEIDIICRKGTTLVFVEVRYRQIGAPVDALGSVDAGKQRRLLRSGDHYLEFTREPYDDVRYDIIAINGRSLDHIEDAFDDDG